MTLIATVGRQRLRSASRAAFSTPPAACFRTVYSRPV